jgi:hypothetical protein
MFYMDGSSITFSVVIMGVKQPGARYREAFCLTRGKKENRISLALNFKKRRNLMRRMNRRDFGKLLLAATAAGMAGFPRGGDAAGSQASPSPMDPAFRAKLESMGKQFQENQALKQAMTRINRNTIIIESQKFFKFLPRVYGRAVSAIDLSPAELSIYRNAISAIAGEMDRSGLTDVLFQILSGLPSDFRFADPNFIREETSLILRISGINMSADIAKFAPQADIKRGRYRQQAGSHPTASEMLSPGGTGGGSGHVAGIIANLKDLIDNGNNSLSDIGVDILSCVLGVLGLAGVL